jgi:hypothetical protein
MTEIDENTIADCVYALLVNKPQAIRRINTAIEQAMLTVVQDAKRDASTFDQGMLALLSLTGKGRITGPLKATLTARVCKALELGGGSQIEREARDKYAEAGQ